MPTPWIRIQSAMLAAVLTTALAVHLLLRRPVRRIYQEYAFLALNLVLWFLADALYALFGLSSPVLDTIRLLVATAIPITTVRFFRGLLEDQSALGRRLQRSLVALGVGVGLLVVFLAPSSQSVPPWIANAGLILYVFGGVYASNLLIGRRLKQTVSLAERGRLKSLLVASLLAVSLVLLDYLPSVGYFFFGNIFVMLFLYFLFQIITKLRLLDLYEFLGRSVVTLTFGLVIAAIFLFLTLFWRDRADLFIFNAVIAALVVIILFEPLKNAVSDWIAHFLFSERFAFAAQLERLRAEIAKILETPKLCQRIVEALDDSRRVTHASVYLLSSNGRRYELSAWVGSEPRRALDVAQDRPLLELLDSERIVTLEGLVDELKGLRYKDTLDAQGMRERINQVIKILDDLYAALIVPFSSDDRILGFLAVNDDRLREPYSSDEISLIHKVATQAAIAIENSRVYEKLSERDRLAALGEMSAGLAHEIRNPLGAIKGAAQLLAESEGDPESQTEFATVIADEVDRLNVVVTQFLHFAKPYRGHQQEVDVNDLVRRTLQLLEAKRPEGIEVRLDLDAGLPEVWTDPEMVRTIFLNLALNAFEAMAEHGVLTVRSLDPGPVAGRAGISERGRMLAVQFQDTGGGIPADDLSRIFIPFFTTKARGTGLGLSICQRVIRSLGGFIEVQSDTGRGTLFSVFLPRRIFSTSEMPSPTPSPERFRASPAFRKGKGGDAD